MYGRWGDGRGRQTTENRSETGPRGGGTASETYRTRKGGAASATYRTRRVRWSV